MAEVGQRLGSGAYRLSALRNSQSRPVRTGESPVTLLVSCTFNDSRTKEESNQIQGEIQPVSKSRVTQRKIETLSRVRRSEIEHQHRTLRCPTLLELDSSRLNEFFQTRESLHAHITALCLSERLQPPLQEKLLPGRMSSWTRGAVSVHSDTFRSPQQLRAFCTVLFILSEQGSERAGGDGLRLRRLKPHPDPLLTCTTTSSRSYSWRSGRSSNDASPLYRSKTAYYDILKVSPGATQSQIKTAYYKQSFIFHPDKNQGDKEASQRFTEISEAYTVLGSISLRRKYDRGILSQSDVHSAGRPSSKETASRPTAGSPQQQQHQQRARRVTHVGGKPMFDFDAFYRHHYGEQLQREKDLRARKQAMQEEQKKENLKKWRQGKAVEMTVFMMLGTAGLILFNLSNS